MARNQLPPQIRKISVTDRRTAKEVVRYQVTVDAGTREVPRLRPDGSTYLHTTRSQSRRRFDTEKDARAYLARVTDEVNRGVHVSGSTLSVDEVCEAWLAGRRVRPTTKNAYRHALEPLRQFHGAMPVQRLTKGHLDSLVTALAAGGTPMTPQSVRRPWSPQSINPMLNIISAVLTDLVKQGLLVRNVALLVDRLPRTQPQMRTFSVEEMRQMLAFAQTDRVGHAWNLALSGLRRGEICGLRWSDVDLDAGVMSIRNNRVSVAGQAVDGLTKTERSNRDLPLTPVLTAALIAARERQDLESAAAGANYGPGTHIVCDVLGHAYHPDTLSNFWQTACKRAGVPQIRLHDARHTCATLMHLQNVPIAVISAWLGHADSAFTMRTYAHAPNDALKIAAQSLQTMSDLHGN
ncbi:recombinase XerD [Rhodococcus sp. Leaf225]|nr:recombinase XerD [Rhodococcus sp. Leaf225]KQU46502.1 recombinase XerD [Rhodococcus sp. Leaf258]